MFIQLHPLPLVLSILPAPAFIMASTYLDYQTNDMPNTPPPSFITIDQLQLAVSWEKSSCIAIVLGCEQPRETITGDFSTKLVVIDMSYGCSKKVLEVKFFQPPDSIHRLPVAVRGQVVALKNFCVKGQTQSNPTITYAVGYHDSAQWAIFDSTTQRITHNNQNSLSSEEENFLWSCSPLPSQALRYMRELEHWWRHHEASLSWELNNALSSAKFRGSTVNPAEKYSSYRTAPEMDRQNEYPQRHANVFPPANMVMGSVQKYQHVTTVQWGFQNGSATHTTTVYN